MLKSWRHWLEKGKQLSRQNLLLIALAGVLLCVVTVPVTKEKPKEMAKEDEKTDRIAKEYTSFIEEAETKLETMLIAMEGVGKAKVMITLQDEGSLIVEKDETIAKDQKTEETIYQQETSSVKVPFITQKITPKIEGVFVVAQGGSNAVIAKNISDAILALFPCQVHKIKVVEMKH